MIKSYLLPLIQKAECRALLFNELYYYIASIYELVAIALNNFKVQEDNHAFLFDQLKEVKSSAGVPVLFGEAKGFLESHQWCRNIITGWYDENVSLLDKLGVFLFEIEPINADVDRHIWIIVGDLPSVYLDASVKTGEEALETYCDLMEHWSNNVLQGRSLEVCYPVEAAPKAENAELLKSRIAFIRKEILLLPDA